MEAILNGILVKLNPPVAELCSTFMELVSISSLTQTRGVTIVIISLVEALISVKLKIISLAEEYHHWVANASLLTSGTIAASGICACSTVL
jgi:hypothetical protein